MNKYQEALSRMFDNLNYASNYYLDDKCDDDYDILFELVEKATPKEGVLGYNNFGYSTLCCPNCKKTIVNVWSKAEYEPNYCHYCGQALDWSEEDDC